MKGIPIPNLPYPYSRLSCSSSCGHFEFQQFHKVIAVFDNLVFIREMSSKPIFLATHPRSCSTAFERVRDIFSKAKPPNLNWLDRFL